MFPPQVPSKDLGLKAIATFLALSLFCPPAFALRVSQPEYESQRIVLDETLRDPDKAPRLSKSGLEEQSPGCVPLQISGLAAPTAAAYDPQWKILFILGRDEIKIFDAISGEPAGWILSLKGRPLDAAYDPVGKVLFVATELANPLEEKSYTYDLEAFRITDKPSRVQFKQNVPSALIDFVKRALGFGLNRFEFYGESIGIDIAPWDLFRGFAALAYDPNEKRLFVADSYGPLGNYKGRLRTFNALTEQRIHDLINGLIDPIALAYDSVRGTLFVLERKEGRLRCFDAETGKPTGVVISGLQNPNGLAYDPDTQMLFVTERNANRLRAFDGRTGRDAGLIIEGLDTPLGIAYDPVSQILFVTEGTAGRLRAFSAVDGKPTAVFPAAGMEEPPWPAGTGRERGVEEFKDFGVPPEVLDKLQDPKSTLIDRSLALAGYLGWSGARLAAAAGMGVSLVSYWKSSRPQEPLPGTVKKVSGALKVDPVFLLTGLPRQRAFRLATIIRRIQFLMWERGMSQQELAQRMGKEQARISEIVVEKSEPTRDTILKMADVFEVSPVLMETGFEPPSGSLLFEPAGRTGFSASPPAKNKSLAGKAQNLEEALLQAWGMAGLPVDQWRNQIEADPMHFYPGLAYRLLSARPGALEQAVHYGLFSQGVADKLRQKIPLTQEEITELALDLATAHHDLTELLEAPTSQLKLDQGYRNDKHCRIAHPWDLIARFMNRKRILLLLDRTQVNYLWFKTRMVTSSHPEGTVAEKEKRARVLAGAFPQFSEKMIRRYAWTYQQPEEKLREAEHYYNHLVDLLQRRWVHPPADLYGYLRSPEAFANLTIASTPARAENILSAITRRDAAIRMGLTTQQAEVLRQLSTQLPGLAADLEGPQTAPGYSQARDLLNRIVAWRQASEPNFFSDAPHPELDPPDAAIAYAQPLIQQVAVLLQQAEAHGQWPKSLEETDLFLRNIAVLMTKQTAGLEEKVREPVRRLLQKQLGLDKVDDPILDQVVSSPTQGNISALLAPLIQNQLKGKEIDRAIRRIPGLVPQIAQVIGRIKGDIEKQRRQRLKKEVQWAQTEALPRIKRFIATGNIPLLLQAAETFPGDKEGWLQMARQAIQDLQIQRRYASMPELLETIHNFIQRLNDRWFIQRNLLIFQSSSAPIRSVADIAQILRLGHIEEMRRYRWGEREIPVYLILEDEPVEPTDMMAGHVQARLILGRLSVVQAKSRVYQIVADHAATALAWPDSEIVQLGHAPGVFRLSVEITSALQQRLAAHRRTMEAHVRENMLYEELRHWMNHARVEEALGQPVVLYTDEFFERYVEHLLQEGGALRRIWREADVSPGQQVDAKFNLGLGIFEVEGSLGRAAQSLEDFESGLLNWIDQYIGLQPTEMDQYKIDAVFGIRLLADELELTAPHERLSPQNWNQMSRERLMELGRQTHSRLEEGFQKLREVISSREFKIPLTAMPVMVSQQKVATGLEEAPPYSEEELRKLGKKWLSQGHVINVREIRRLVASWVREDSPSRALAMRVVNAMRSMNERLHARLVAGIAAEKRPDAYETWVKDLPETALVGPTALILQRAIRRAQEEQLSSVDIGLVPLVRAAGWDPESQEDRDTMLGLVKAHHVQVRESVQPPVLFVTPQTGLLHFAANPIASTGLEERMPGWLQPALGEDWMEVITGVYEMAQVTDKVAVLLQPELLGVAAGDGDTEVALMSMEGSLHGAFGWPEQTDLRLGLLTPQSEAAFEGKEYRVIRVVRHPESEETPLPWEAVPILVAEALASGQPTFRVNVTPYLNLKGITLPEILATLTNLFA